MVFPSFETFVTQIIKLGVARKVEGFFEDKILLQVEASLPGENGIVLLQDTRNTTDLVVSF